MPLSSSRVRTLLSLIFFTAVMAFSFVPAAPKLSHVSAAVYNGGLNAGITAAGSIEGVSSGNPREVIGKIVNTVLSYVAILAVSVIIFAGIYLIISFGNDQAKETAKKVIIYTAAGLLIILLSKAIVTLFISFAGE